MAEDAEESGVIVLHLSNGQTKRLQSTDLLYAGGRMKRADQIQEGDTLLAKDPLGMGDFVGDVAYKGVKVLVVREEQPEPCVTCHTTPVQYCCQWQQNREDEDNV